jgi:putative chitinase
MTQVDFKNIFGHRESKRVAQLNDFWETYEKIAVPRLELNTVMRKAAFIAQVGHESDEFRAREEYASGEAYEGRRNLGNTQKGDGVKYKGRGYIQLTGRANYTTFNKWYQQIDPEAPDLVTYPHLIAQDPELSMWATVYYWETRKLNRYADRGMFETLTRRINGRLNGYAHRLEIFEKIYKQLTK